MAAEAHQGRPKAIGLCTGPHGCELHDQDKFQHAGVPFSGRKSHWRPGKVLISSQRVPAKAFGRVSLW